MDSKVRGLLHSVGTMDAKLQSFASTTSNSHKMLKNYNRVMKKLLQADYSTQCYWGILGGNKLAPFIGNSYAPFCLQNVWIYYLGLHIVVCVIRETCH